MALVLYMERECRKAARDLATPAKISIACELIAYGMNDGEGQHIIITVLLLLLLTVKMSVSPVIK